MHKSQGYMEGSFSHSVTLAQVLYIVSWDATRFHYDFSASSFEILLRREKKEWKPQEETWMTKTRIDVYFFTEIREQRAVDCFFTYTEFN